MRCSEEALEEDHPVPPPSQQLGVDHLWAFPTATHLPRLNSGLIS